MKQDYDKSCTRRYHPPRLLLIFLLRVLYHGAMDSHGGDEDRPEIAAARRGGTNALGMQDEAQPATASAEVALFWRGIYGEIVGMEEAVLERIQQLKVLQSPEARQEVELTNVPVVVSQLNRFRWRWGVWDARVRALADMGEPSKHPNTVDVAADVMPRG